MRGEFEYDDELTPGKTDDGGWSGLLFREGERGVVDHGAFYPDSDEEPEEADADSDEPSPDWVVPAAVGLAVGVIVTYVVVKATPRVRRWWSEVALPAIRAKGKSGPNSRQADVEVVVPEDVTYEAREAFADEVEAVLEDSRTLMSSREVQERLLSILLAAAFIAEQVRALHNARIEPEPDDPGAPELQKTMADLTTQEITDTINRALEADASLLTDETSSRLMEYFGGGGYPNGQYMPLTNARVKEALRLTGPLP